MKVLKHSLSIALIFTFPFFLVAQDEETEKGSAQKTITVMNFSVVPAEGQLYFKATLKGLEKDMHLVLEKEVKGKKEPIVVDTQKGVATKASLPLLYSFKDQDPGKASTLYRLRGISFTKEGDAEVKVLAEKRFPKGLLGMKEGD